MEEITLAGALIAAAHVARPVVESGVHFLRSLLGESVQIAGAMISDRLYLWQLENRVSIAAKARKLVEDCHIPPRQVATGFLFPLLEAAGNVEDENLQDLWAQLLANAVNADSAQHPLFIETLKRMSHADAVFLEKLSKDRRVLPFPLGRAVKLGSFATARDENAARLLAIGILAPVLRVDVAQPKISIELTPTSRTAQQFTARLAKKIGADIDDRRLQITEFGRQFIKEVMQKPSSPELK